MTAANTLIRGQIAFITGASSGIGQAVAQALASLGVHLILTARRASRLEAIAESLTQEYGVRVLTRVLDVRDQEAVAHCVTSLPADWQSVDILINNAGLALGLSPVQSGDVQLWDQMIDTNIKGLLYVTRAVLPGMLARSAGHVVNLGSIAGHQVYPNGNVYCASKFAVRALSEGIKMDVHGTPIRVTEIDPGLVETEFSLVRFAGDAERAKHVYSGMQALSAEDVAEVIAFCLTRKPHVNIMSVRMYPTDQSSVQLVHREEN